jgi:hypothetical protein
MGEVERATWEISCRSCDPTKPSGVIPESSKNGFFFSRAVNQDIPLWDFPGQPIPEEAKHFWVVEKPTS